MTSGLGISTSGRLIDSPDLDSSVVAGNTGNFSTELVLSDTFSTGRASVDTVEFAVVVKPKIILLFCPTKG